MTFHENLGQKLVDHSYIKSNSPKLILEIGSHDGLVTKSLKAKFPKSTIVALDLKKMQHLDSNYFICGNGENLPFQKGTFDLIVSGGTFQWFHNLEVSLVKIRELLTDDGVLSFSVFLNGSMKPLSDSFINVGLGNRLLKMKKQSEIDSSIDQSWSVLAIENMTGTDYFDSLKSQIAYLRRIGATKRNDGMSRISRSHLHKLRLELEKSKYENSIPLYWDASLYVLKKKL